MTETSESILILDDDARRRRVFAQVYPSAVLVETAADAIRVRAARRHWAHVSLDHDLDFGGLRPDIPLDTPSGMAVVEWLVDHPHTHRDTLVRLPLCRPRDIQRLTIHSTNGLAAPDMFLALKDAAYDHVKWRPWPTCLTDADRVTHGLTADPEIWPTIEGRWR